MLITDMINRDYEIRDKIIFGKYEPDKYSGGCRNFTCSRDTIQKLMDECFISPTECQNYSPSTKEFMEATEDFEDVTFECYAISPDRDDYRVTIEGVDIVVSDSDYELISLAVETFHWADEFSFEHAKNKYYLHAWWD